MLEKEKVRIK